MTRTLHFGLFIYPGGHHLAGWRHPSVAAKEILSAEYYKRAAITAERGCFDLYFVGDMLAARERERDAFIRSTTWRRKDTCLFDLAHNEIGRAHV